MTSTKPYLIRAIRDWAQDNGFTPQLLVSAVADGVKVPAGYVQDGHITLNIHAQAVRDLELGDDWILFSARFGGVSFNVEVPVGAVLAVFARENGQGISFKEQEGGSEPPPTPPASAEPPAKKGPRLKLVK